MLEKKAILKNANITIYFKSTKIECEKNDETIFILFTSVLLETWIGNSCLIE